ncbi:hypothetical protein BpHYR1_034076 [Brachionus plicatilis]|uniref:Uncharacterized protein n=1 Tax=Brachionus plicatilis TaxID=10195 RepID=A0A3M7R8Q4_BRAPC|nr:hypothetical protein BpHYR1_034076 [Brachionus plicatilis]
MFNNMCPTKLKECFSNPYAFCIPILCLNISIQFYYRIPSFNNDSPQVKTRFWIMHQVSSCPYSDSI